MHVSGEKIATRKSRGKGRFWLNLLVRILAEGRQGVAVSPRRVVEDEGFDQILKMIRF